MSDSPYTQGWPMTFNLGPRYPAQEEIDLVPFSDAERMREALKEIANSDPRKFGLPRIAYEALQPRPRVAPPLDPERMRDELDAVGSELVAAREDNDRMRGAFAEIRKIFANRFLDTAREVEIEGIVHAALFPEGKAE